jgi:hypothetical protein
MGVGARVVVSGGTAVDLYAAGASGTSEGYPAKWRPSADVDVVLIETLAGSDLHRQLLGAVERELGIRPRHPGVPRVLDVPELPFGLDLMPGELNGDPRAERVVTILVDGQHPATFRGPEDIILAYAESGWHLRHQRDWERALAVFAAMRDRLDVPYLVAEAERRGQRPAIERVLRLEPLRRSAA